MGSEARFAMRVAAWIAALAVATIGLALTIITPGLAAARIVAAVAVAAIGWGLWRHVSRTGHALSRFVEAIGSGDGAVRFERAAGTAFGGLGAALDTAIARARAGHDRTAEELRFNEALIDDLPVAFLIVGAGDEVRPGNRAARRLLGTAVTTTADLGRFGATFAARIAARLPIEEVLYLRLDGHPQRALVRIVALARAGDDMAVVSLQPIESTLGSTEMLAQTDLVRVLTHEILNSLTPVMSLAATARDLIADPAPDALAQARTAIDTLARRAEGLRHFIDAYRAVANPPVLTRSSFAARRWADELALLFASEWPGTMLHLAVTPAHLQIDGDAALLAQVTINLLRNAAQAMAENGIGGQVRLSIASAGAGEVEIVVADSGPGIAPAIRRDIFLPFFTTRTAGSGIGLNLARQIVLAHGGSLLLRSAAAGETAFVVRLQRRND